MHRTLLLRQQSRDTCSRHLSRFPLALLLLSTVTFPFLSRILRDLLRLILRLCSRKIHPPDTVFTHCVLGGHLLKQSLAVVSYTPVGANFTPLVLVMDHLELPLVGGGGGASALPLTRLIGRTVHVSTTATQVSLNTHEGLCCSKSSSSRSSSLFKNDAGFFIALSVSYTGHHQVSGSLTGLGPISEILRHCTP